MTHQSKTVRKALDNIRYVLEYEVPSGVTIEYPHLSTGPVEHVLVFNIKEHHTLKDTGTPTPYFSNQGYFTDVQSRVLAGSSCKTSLAVDASKLATTYEWPPEQPAPFDRPPSLFVNTDPLGHSKQAYFFGDGSSLVTTGPSVPKLLRLKGGGAQLWVASVGVIAQGTGKYEGARGLSSYVGSASFAVWPTKVGDQLKTLAAGFEAVISASFKLVFKADIA